MSGKEIDALLSTEIDKVLLQGGDADMPMHEV